MIFKEQINDRILRSSVVDYIMGEGELQRNPGSNLEELPRYDGRTRIVVDLGSNESLQRICDEPILHDVHNQKPFVQAVAALWDGFSYFSRRNLEPVALALVLVGGASYFVNKLEKSEVDTPISSDPSLENLQPVRSFYSRPHIPLKRHDELRESPSAVDVEEKLYERAAEKSLPEVAQPVSPVLPTSRAVIVEETVPEDNEPEILKAVPVSQDELYEAAQKKVELHNKLFGIENEAFH